MSADLPEARPDGGSTVMAKRLVTYLDDPEMIRSAIKAEYGTAPCVRTIRIMRSAYIAERDKPEIEPRPCDGWKREEEAEAAAERSRLFLALLERERRFSIELALSNGALNSPLLTRQHLVDNALEREVEKARKGCGF